MSHWKKCDRKVELGSKHGGKMRRGSAREEITSSDQLVEEMRLLWYSHVNIALNICIIPKEVIVFVPMATKGGLTPTCLHWVDLAM